MIRYKIMRKINSIITVIMLGVVALAIVTLDDGVNKYSCDEDINRFITNNLELVQSLDREQVVTFDHHVQKAIVSTWPEVKLRQAFNEKAIIDAEHFEGEQKAFILDVVYRGVQPSEERLVEVLGKENAIKVFYNLETIDEQAAHVLVAQPDGSGEPPEGDGTPCGGCDTEDDGGDGGAGGALGMCDCNIGSAFSCASCRTMGCTSASSGCGWMWYYPCNGGC